MPVWREEESQEENVRLAICVGHEFVVEGLVSYGCVRLRVVVNWLHVKLCLGFQEKPVCCLRIVHTA